ncbi:MAG: 4'-phosphopantetheinyl transferase superfamily protein [Chthoniobacterales bacterium]
MIFRTKWISDPALFPDVLLPGEIHVWKISGSHPASVVTEAERRKAEGIKNVDAGMQYILSRSVPRELMARYLKKSALDFVLEYNSHGKPFFSGEEIHFNTSHCGNQMVIAFCRDAAVGIDIENGSRVRNSIAIAKRYFAPEEVSYLETESEEDVRAAFLRLWVCKEAALKSSGHGIEGGLQQTRVQFGAELVIHRGIDQKELTAVEFTPEDGFYGAIVAELPIPLKNVKWFVL